MNDACLSRRAFMIGACGAASLAAAAGAVPLDVLPQDMLPGFATGLPNAFFDNLVNDAPRVRPLDLPFDIMRAGHLCVAREEIAFRAVILARRRYFLDRFSIAPLDMVAGWNEMSNPAILRTVRISLSSRDFSFDVRPPPRITQSVLRQTVGVFHLIPESLALRDKVLSLRRNHIVSLSGYLCDVRVPSGEYMVASGVSRTGAARRIILVREVQRLGFHEV